jgi:UDP-N-acetylmuramate dehydrogenase
MAVAMVRIGELDEGILKAELFEIWSLMGYNENMNMPSDLADAFLQDLGNPLERSVPLWQYSHFKIGGEADFFFEATTEKDLIKAITFVRQKELPFYVIGGGFNLLFDDAGFRGVIIRNRVTGIEASGGTEITVASGTSLESLLEFCLEEEWGGLEFLVGIPGTVGGAVFGNAGAFDQDIGAALNHARLLTPTGEIIQVDNAFFCFAYRYSSLKETPHILLQTTLECFAKDRHHIEALLQEYLKKREKKHPPWGVACAGSYFKNPQLPSGEKIPAAFLLDKVGAKGMRVGDAEVFSGHANFIINRGKATSRDVRELAVLLREKVRERFEVELREEVMYLPAEPGSP